MNHWYKQYASILNNNVVYTGMIVTDQGFSTVELTA